MAINKRISKTRTSWVTVIIWTLDQLIHQGMNKKSSVCTMHMACPNKWQIEGIERRQNMYGNIQERSESHQLILAWLTTLLHGICPKYGLALRLNHHAHTTLSKIHCSRIYVYKKRKIHFWTIIPHHTHMRNAVQSFPLNLLHLCQHQRQVHSSNPNLQIEWKLSTLLIAKNELKRYKIYSLCHY